MNIETDDIVLTICYTHIIYQLETWWVGYQRDTASTGKGCIYYKQDNVLMENAVFAIIKIIY